LSALRAQSAPLHISAALAVGLARPKHSCDQPALFEFGTGFSLPETDAVTPGLSFLPGDIKYESPNGNVRVYFPKVTSIVLSVVLTLILRLFS